MAEKPQCEAVARERVAFATLNAHDEPERRIMLTRPPSGP